MLISKKEKLDSAIVRHHVRDMKLTYMRKNKIEFLEFGTKDLINHCYEKYRDKFVEPGLTKNVFMKKHWDYVRNRKKAGVIVITNDLKILLVHSCKKLCLPKGKEEYFDEDLKETAFRELKEETGMMYIE